MKTTKRINAACAIAALLLSATDTPAATITVANGDDAGQVHCDKRFLAPRQAIRSTSPQALRLLL